MFIGQLLSPCVEFENFFSLLFSVQPSQGRIQDFDFDFDFFFFFFFFWGGGREQKNMCGYAHHECEA